ncbi:DMT family transporter [Anaerospora sp.]|uniref:DMT family transporter n=1 Tax=Anaerospora sp. TaxID=1960278 RepID=UPI00289DC877|nr:DMT family transporter [Anaerospora sp.]
MSSTHMGMLYLAGAFSLAGTSVIAGSLLSGILGVFTISAISLLFALVGLLPFCAANLRAALPLLSWRTWMELFFQALFGIFLFRLFLLQALLLTSAGEAGILTGVTPAVTAVLARLLLKEPLDRGQIAGIVSTVSGIAVLQGLLSTGTQFTQQHFTGNMLVLCAALSESLFNVLSRLASVKAAERALSPIAQSALVSAIALLLCLIPALNEQADMRLSLLNISSWAALLWYGLFVTALAFIFWYEGIKRCKASVAAAFTGLMPVTSLLLAVLFLGEQANVQQWAGGLLVMAGMVLTGRNKEKNFTINKEN